MNPEEFKAWRRFMSYSQGEAALALGLSIGSIVNYERGFRLEDRRVVEIPKSIELACAALTAFGETDAEFVLRMCTTSVKEGLPTEGEAERMRAIDFEAFERRVFERLATASC